MRKLVSLVGIGLLLSTMSAAAEEESPGEKAAAAEPKAEPAPAAPSSSGAKYGPAGCGLGSLLFKPESGFLQVLAATTNGSSGNQTFGITSGTSNCDTGPSSKDSAKAFVQTNRQAMAKDIARGKGETITSLSELAGCQDSAAVGARLQRRFKTIFPSAKVSDEQVSDSVVEVLKSEELACSNLG